jgi:subtilisin family serine protease
MMMMMMMMKKKLLLSLVVLLIGIQVVQAVQAQTQSSSLPPPSLRSNNEDVSLSLSFSSSSSSSSLRLLQKKNNDIDYTCYPSLDYSGENKCPTIGDGKCDNPNHGGTEELCIEQDCIDCNFNCQSFSTDCYGCMTAIGCYYCEGDATCNNSNLYKSSNKVLSCTKLEDFFLGGLGDSKEKCIPPNAPTQDPLSIANEWMFKMINVQYVWNTLKLTGKGIKIRINDDGVDINNKEFEGNNKFDKANSCEEWEPTPGDTDGHGTTVAGIIVGNANNDFCSAGIAYDATFSACNFFAKGVPYSSLAYKINTFDISQNSIGSP